MLMSNRDNAAAYYEQAENLEPAGLARRRSGPARRLTTHIPVRFSAAVIERVKELAADEGKTVSFWIRDVVDQEVFAPQLTGGKWVRPALEILASG
jgi:hypothetical protein